MKILNEQKPWWKASSNELVYIKNLKNTVNDGHITFSKNCIKIENYLKKILKVRYVILANSGTSALFMATLAANLENKKKVFCPVMTWSGTINGSLYSQKKIEFIDNKKGDVNAEYKSFVNKIGKNDILFLTHLNGKSAYDKQLYKILKKKNFFVIEDAAQAFLAKDFNNKYLGTQFDIGCFSLSYTKMCNMVYGGFCVTNNLKLAKLLKTIRNNGVDNDKQIANSVGGNFKPNDLNASIGIESLNSAFRNKKKLVEIYKTYKKYLKNKKINILKYNNLKKEFPIYIEVVVENRNKFINFLKKKKIGYSYSTRSLSRSKHIYSKRLFKNADKIDKMLLRLPSGPGYNKKDIIKIVNQLNEF
tara:strand:- start:780 stop:1862 length:1083 start_codon:yes stop_codon:yes gene_type:complete